MRAAVPQESGEDEDGPEVVVPQAARRRSASKKARGVFLPICLTHTLIWMSVAVIEESEEESDLRAGPVDNVPQGSSFRKVRGRC
jgi:hypothetical protein